MTIEFNVLTAIISVGIAVITFVLGRQTAARKDGEDAAELRAEIKHLREIMERVERQGSIDNARIEGKADAANRRLDRHEEKYHGFVKPTTT